MESKTSLLPANHPQRELLHNEVHARPPARIRQPALLTYVAVFNEGVDREQECALLRRLPGQAALTVDDLQGNFLRLRLPGYTLKWERHTEFTRYSIVQPLPEGCGLGAREPDLLTPLATPPGWLAGIPGRTFAAIQLVMVEEPIHPPAAALAQARTWFGEHTVVASLMGNNAHSLAVTDFWLRPCGFERMLAVCPPGTSETRAGRIAARLFELETYRLMALRALPVVKDLAPLLARSERQLADITAQLENKGASDQALLDTLAPMARYVREQGYPPESIDILTGQASGPAPSGFSAAMLPFLRAMGDDKALQSQRMRLEARPLRPKAYYEQVLALFGQGAFEGQYRFTATGQLLARWKP